MKNLNTDDYGLMELSHEEQKEITGGLFGLLAVIFGIVAAVAALIDYAQNN